MKKIFLSTALIFATMALSAQDLPQPSPTATLTQRVGLTDITINYSRPGMKEREVFGELVPYGEMWRTGANMNTTVEFSTDVTVGGERLQAGKYSLFTIPNEGVWTVIFNKKTDHGGTSGYTEENDVMRMEVEAQEMESPVETFTIDVNDIRNESANIWLLWANTAVAIPLKFQVNELAMTNIKKAMKDSPKEDMWKVYRNAANYYHQNDLDDAMALKYMDKSLGMKKDSWYSHYLRGQILADMGKSEEAVASAKMAMKVGQKQAEKDGEEFGYHKMLEEAMEKWSNQDS